jgi:hypothetical protein
VVENLYPNSKWIQIAKSVMNADLDLETYGYDSLAISMAEPVSQETDTPPIDASKDAVNGKSLMDSWIDFYSGASSRKAKLVTVAKNSTSRRTITIEPVLNQFIQQGLNTLLRDSISECPVLSLSLDLSDQNKNKNLALEGSLLGNWATIDLKSASDLLSVQLVELVFRHHGPFLDHMMDCRSPSVKCGEETIFHLRKFAGMGNALTFPVQSVCFAVVCIACILVTSGKRVSYWNCRQAARHIRVFGDDIIVDTKYARQCVHWLQQVGLKVNKKKSFLEGNFRESCGVDAFMGVDITPIYLRYRPDDGSKDPNAIAGLVSTSNQAWLDGLYSFSACLAEEVEERLEYSLPLVSVRTGALGWHTHLDAMTAHKWCPSLQQLVTKSVVLSARKRADRLDGYAALFKFYHVPLLGRGVKHLSSTPWRFHLRLSKKYVPTMCMGFKSYKDERSHTNGKGVFLDIDPGWLPLKEEQFTESIA